MPANRPSAVPNTGFGHITGCEIVRVESDAGALELFRCAPSCPHGEIYLPRLDQPNWLANG